MTVEHTTRRNAIPLPAERRLRIAAGKPLSPLAGFTTFFNRYLVVWLVPVLIIVLWQLAAQFEWIPTRILPAPLKVIQASVKMISSGELLRDISVSTLRAGTGLFVGGSIGFLLGMSNGLFKLSEKLFDTTIQMIRTIPNLALLPLVILWFGIGDSARLFLISLGVFFPIYLNTFHGIRNVDPDLIEMGRVYGLSKWQLFRQVIFPGALPSILVGIRLSLGIMWLTLIVAETIAVDSGIGFMAATAREFIRTDVLIFVVVLYALLGKLSDVVTHLLERRLLRWQRRYQTSDAAA
jgi:sulfonate transport system permease protein